MSVEALWETYAQNSDAVLVLKAARTMMGDRKFIGSMAEAIRLSALKRDLPTIRAVKLMSCVRTIDRMIEPLSKLTPLYRAASRSRMIADCDSAIAKLEGIVKTLAKQRGVGAIKDAWNWGNLKPNDPSKPVDGRDKEVSRIFPLAFEEQKKLLPDPGYVRVEAPKPDAQTIYSSGVGSRATKDDLS